MTATDDAYALCTQLARQHYENFPVASRLLPRRLRPAVAAIYAFARTADDIADEHDFDTSTRLALLQRYRDELARIDAGGQASAPIFVALQASIARHQLPLAPFYDLLSAFTQDVTKSHYENFAELQDYCRRSANPVGRLLLCLFARDDAPRRAQADAICTALQLTNFLQDLTIDAQRGRIYLPQDELRAHGVDASYIFMRRSDASWRALIEIQITRIETLFDFGAPLGRTLPARLGLQIRLTVAGGRRVLHKLRRQNRAGFIGGARLHAWDWATMLGHALWT